jgi:hypothetical protein
MTLDQVVPVAIALCMLVPLVCVPLLLVLGTFPAVQRYVRDWRIARERSQLLRDNARYLARSARLRASPPSTPKAPS